MEVRQVATIINTIASEMFGDDAIQTEDLSNIVDVGNAFADILTDGHAMENFTKSLIDHIGRVVVVNRAYRKNSIGIARDAWEYGGILEKINIELPEATTNESWALTSGTKYDDILVYTPPSVSAKFYDKMVTFDIPMSFALKQVKTAFSSAAQFNAFIAGIENMISTAISFYGEMLERRTINSLAVSAPTRINLLAMYNGDGHPGNAAAITAATAINDPAFLRYAAAKIAEYSDFMGELSKSFNAGRWAKQTPAEYQRFVVLSRFARNIEVYSESDTYHNEFVKLIPHIKVSAWQAVGDNTAESNRTFADLSTIKAIPADSADGETVETLSGVVGVLFDRDAAAVCNEDYRVTSFWNAGNETTKNYYKWDARYLNDLNENVIVFVVADATAGG